MTLHQPTACAHGRSHYELRTPLTRVRIELELARREGASVARLDRVERDIEAFGQGVALKGPAEGAAAGSLLGGDDAGGAAGGS